MCAAHYSAAFRQAIIKYYEIHHRYDLLQPSKQQFPQLNPAEECQPRPPLRYLLSGPSTACRCLRTNGREFRENPRTSKPEDRATRFRQVLPAVQDAAGDEADDTNRRRRDTPPAYRPANPFATVKTRRVSAQRDCALPASHLVTLGKGGFHTAF